MFNKVNINVNKENLHYTDEIDYYLNDDTIIDPIEYLNYQKLLFLKLLFLSVRLCVKDCLV